MRRIAAAVPVAVVVAAAIFTLLRSDGPAGAAEHPAAEADVLEGERLAEARQLYLLNCSSCHGATGEGTDVAPSLEQSGAASAFYYLATGRMPMADYEQQPRRKDLRLTTDEIRLLVAYVAALGDGPALPVVDPVSGDLALGGVLYRANCAACHAAAGIGGALSYGQAAPTISQADPLVIASAVRAGPGLMPVFGEQTLDEEELAAVVRYALYLQDPVSPGGATLGGAGPVPEGFVGWVVGVGMLVLATFWIGRVETGDPPDVVEPGAEAES